MIIRAFSTVLLALLAWIPVGRGQASPFRSDTHERALFATSALELAAESPARVAQPLVERLQSAVQRKPSPWRVLAPIVVDAERSSDTTRSTPHASAGRSAAVWRGFADRRLIVPHDATAPPSQS